MKDANNKENEGAEEANWNIYFLFIFSLSPKLHDQFCSLRKVYLEDLDLPAILPGATQLLRSTDF